MTTNSLTSRNIRQTKANGAWCHLQSSISRPKSLSTRSSIVCFLLVMAAIVSRRPDWITNPQFFGDEVLWFSDAYRSGAWHALLTPYQSYFCTAQRIINVLSVHLPLLYAPVVCSAFGILIHTATFWYLLTSRLERAAPLPARALVCFFWIAAPNSAELLTMTNTQWILAVLGALIVVSKPSNSTAWRIFDVVVILLMGLTGPYCILLLPVAFAMWFARRERWTLLVCLLMVVTASIQVSALRHWMGEVCAGQQVLCANGLNLLAIKIFLVGALGTSPAALHAFISKGAILAGVVVVTGAAVVLLTLLRAPLELRLFVAFSWLIVIAATYRLHCDPYWDWAPMLIPGYAERYWYIAKLGFVACLVWLALDQRLHLIQRIPTMLALLLLAVVALASWRYPAAADLHWSQYAKAFQDAPSGTTISIPINPGWQVPLTKH